VRKGQTATLVVYANKVSIEEEKEGETEIKNIPFLKGYSVFNADQIDGLATLYYGKPPQPQIAPEQRMAKVEQFFAATKAEITNGGARACYSMAEVDQLQIPEDLKARLQKEDNLLAQFEALPPSYRRNVLRWLKLAKTVPTQAKRIEAIATATAQGNRIPQM